MVRVPVGGVNRYHVCPECRTVREEVYSNGAIAEIRLYADWEDLSSLVSSQAAVVLERPEYEQLRLLAQPEIISRGR